jgi:hypothetical protein
MADRSNHYEAAFEAYLRSRGVPYVAVDEARRALFAEVRLKSLDFIVYSRQGKNLLVDVKGRRFPSGAGRSRHLWESWATQEDTESLVRWEEVFGADFQAVLAFAYNIVDERYRERFADRFEYRSRQYGFIAIALEHYRAHMKVRSPGWGTVSLPGRVLRDHSRPFHEFL